MSTERVGDRPTSWAAATSSSGDGGAREALTFLLSEDGAFLGANTDPWEDVWYILP